MFKIFRKNIEFYYHYLDSNLRKKDSFLINLFLNEKVIIKIDNKKITSIEKDYLFKIILSFKHFNDSTYHDKFKEMELYERAYFNSESFEYCILTQNISQLRICVNMIANYVFEVKNTKKLEIEFIE